MRAALPGLLRAAFGELVSIVPMCVGKMSAVADPGRPAMADIPARYDVAHDIGALGGDGSRPRPAHAEGEAASVSIEIARLPAMPRQGDYLTRVNLHTGNAETYRIARWAEAHPGVMVFYLHRIV